MQGDAVTPIAHIIQLAIAPVFLLVGASGLLNVMTGRLARIVDRVRALEEDVLTADRDRRRDDIDQLGILSRRMAICQGAIAMCTLSAILVCVMVIVLFAAGTGALTYGTPIAYLFIAVMAALTLGLVLFFIEVAISTRVVRVRDEYIRARRRKDDS